MASRFTFDAGSAEPPVSPVPASIATIYQANERRRVIEFNGTTQQSMSWGTVVPADYSANFTAEFFYTMASGTSGNAQWRMEVESITPNADTVDLDAAVSYDTANDAASDTVPGTAGHLASISDELTNGDSAAAGDMIRFRVTYLTASTAAGNAFLHRVEIRDAA